MDHCEIWAETLSELRGQMTRETFSTWLRRTQVLESENETLCIGVESERVADWLANRMRSTIERAVASIAGRPLALEFLVVGDESFVGKGGGSKTLTTRMDEREAVAEFVAPDFDTHTAGWMPVSVYEQTFWAPLLGRVAWRVWEIVRQADTRKKKTDWTPARRWSAPSLAALVPCGKQALTGVWRRCEEGVEGAVLRQAQDVRRAQDGADAAGVWQVFRPGAFARLERGGVAEITRKGRLRHTMYTIRVRVKLPLLGPEQVGQLAERLQLAHDQFLLAQGLDPARWW